MKHKPTGFVATCQCGVVVGALDAELTDRAEASRLLGKWLGDGCTVAPRFTGSWSVSVEPCQCDTDNAPTTATPATSPAPEGEQE
jgi:hypothetical protein